MNFKFSRLTSVLFALIAIAISFVIFWTSSSANANIVTHLFNKIKTNCEIILGKRDKPKSEIEFLREIALQEPYMFRGEKSPTVVFSHSKDGYVYLKKVGDQWFSGAPAYGPNTPQGDVRNQLNLFGPELAQKFGFSVEKTSDGLDVLRVPGAEILKSHIMKANAYLKAHQHSPIAYLPVKSGYLTDEEILNLVTDNEGDFLLKFAYGEDDPKLVPHEVSYHLNLLFSEEILARANNITQMMKRLAVFLKSNNSNSPVFKDIASKIINIRIQELDGGTANSTMLLADLRRIYARNTYREIWQKAFLDSEPESQSGYVVWSIAKLCQPDFNLEETIIAAIAKAIDFPNAESLVAHFKLSSKLGKHILATFDNSTRVRPNSTEYEHLLEDLRQFFESIENKTLHANDQLKSPDQITKEWIHSLDARIEEISRAL